jgi:hypothetical protein
MLDTLVSHLPASLQDKAKAVLAFVAAAATVAAALTPVLPEGAWRNSITAFLGFLTVVGVYKVENKTAVA